MLTVVEKVILLQRVDVFADASSEHLALVAAIAEDESVDAGTEIFHEDEPSDAMYVVVEGRVRLQKRETEVASLGQSEAFGTWALFDELARLTSATAVERTRLLRIARDDFIDVLADHVDVTRAILASVARRLRSVLGRIESS